MGCLEAEPTWLPEAEARSESLTVTDTPNQAYGVILIDRTGSMQTVRDNGNTRCSDALAQARTDAMKFFDMEQGAGVALWLFNHEIGVQQVGEGYYMNIAAVEAALAGLDPEDCPGVARTNLADAMCQVADGVADGSAPLDPAPGALYAETDGLENESDGPCSSAISGAPNDMGTWQNNVFMTLFYGGIRVHTKYWIEGDLILSHGDEIVVEAGEPPPIVAGASCATARECESDLFAELAFWTAGDYGIVTDEDPEYACLYGDCPAPKIPE